MTSWAESIKEYEISKRGPLPKAECFKVVSAQERLFREREVDSVAQRFRDPVREELYATTKLNDLKAKAAKYEETSKSKYNIVTNVGPKKEKTLSRQNAPIRDWNCISHLPNEQQKKAPLLYNEAFNESFAYQPKSLSNLGGLAVNAGGRDFNVINNRYNQRHEERIQKEQDSLQEKIIEKYWRTHDYDPIRTKYYNPDKESQFQDQRKLIQTVHGATKLAKIAPSVKNSEGASYDIISNNVVDEEKLSLTTSIKDRSLSKTIGYKVEQDIRSQSDLQETLDESRRMNRQKYERWRGQVDLGYNPINNMDYVYPPELPRPATEYAKLQPTSVSNNKPFRDLSGGSQMGDVDSHIDDNFIAYSQPVQRDKVPALEPPVSSEGQLQPRPRQVQQPTARVNKPTARPVPSLDISKANDGRPNVRYVEPKDGPPGLPVPIVRTGGF